MEISFGENQKSLLKYQQCNRNIYFPRHMDVWMCMNVHFTCVFLDHALLVMDSPHVSTLTNEQDLEKTLMQTDYHHQVSITLHWAFPFLLRNLTSPLLR